MSMKKVGQGNKPSTRDVLNEMNAYRRAASYLSVGDIYLYDNPLLRKPLNPEHMKPRLLGHLGTAPGHGYTPYLVQGIDPEKVHQALAGPLDEIVEEIRNIRTTDFSGSSRASIQPTYTRKLSRTTG